MTNITILDMRQTSQRSHKWCPAMTVIHALSWIENVCPKKQQMFFSRKRNKLPKNLWKSTKTYILVATPEMCAHFELVWIWKDEIGVVQRTKSTLYNELNFIFFAGYLTQRRCKKLLWIYVHMLLYYCKPYTVLYYELLYSATKLCILQSYAGYET